MSDEEHISRPIGGLTSDIVNMLDPSGSRRKKSMTRPKPLSTGSAMALAERPPGRTGVAAGRAGSGVQPRGEVARLERHLGISLPPVFVSSVVAETDADFEVTGYRLENYDGSDAEEALAMLKRLNAAGGERLAAEKLLELKVLCAGAKATSDNSVEFELEVLRRRLRNYPADVIREACDEWGDREKWFPDWASLKAVCEEKVLRRRSLLNALKRYWRVA
jgi:hypothetical protein